MHEWLAGAAPWLAGDGRLEVLVARLDRHFMAPSTALEWMATESQTFGNAARVLAPGR